MDFTDGMRVFVAAAETGSFSGAAARLGMSPKLASKYMAELEARLGARLFQRTTRRLGLTPAGERLMIRAPGWLDDLGEMTGEAREPSRGMVGTLRVSAPVVFGELFVQQMLHRFAAPHPDLVIDLRLSDRYVDLAAEGIDVAVRIGRLDNSSAMARKLGKSTLVLVAAPLYLARSGALATVDDLHRHACIRDANLRGDGAWPLMENGELRRVQVSGRFVVDSARVARDLAVSGEGVTLCPDYVVRDDLAARRLARVLPNVSGPTLDIHALHLGQRRVPRRTRALLDFLAKDRFGGFVAGDLYAPVE